MQSYLSAQPLLGKKKKISVMMWIRSSSRVRVATPLNALPNVLYPPLMQHIMISTLHSPRTSTAVISAVPFLESPAVVLQSGPICNVWSPRRFSSAVCRLPSWSRETSLWLVVSPGGNNRKHITNPMISFEWPTICVTILFGKFTNYCYSYC